ncbi:MAG: amino acid adenylation [Bryobacterales bacterium]|nr:amino acid adenylation [Bryobacterales bacterium]
MIARMQNWLTTQAQRRPEATAVVFRGQPTTYGALEQASNRLARALRMAGCTRGDRVGLLLPKSAKSLIAMFGVLKADCAYVPIDAASPVARIERILQSCECRCLLAEQSAASLLNALIANGFLSNGLVANDRTASSPRIIWMDRAEMDGGGNLPRGAEAPLLWEDLQGLPDSPVESRNDPNDPAHILFTSGSTGTPKGVPITHSNVIHFVRWAVAYFGISRADRISGHPPLHFDLSTFDIYGTIAAGAQLHLLPPEASVLPHWLADFIRDSELTQWFSVPSALLPMAKFDVLEQNDFPALERLLWCGEKFPTPALRYLMRRLPHVTFVNLYGPTEATIASSYYRVPRCPEDNTAEIPIGQACHGETLLVLDDQMNPAAPGEVGDLYIGGAGLSPGYWQDPEKTAEVFRPNPYGSSPADRIYKTGDLARIGDDGMIYLLGRSDSQIKSRGYRIELGEIEAAVQAAPGVQDASVVALDSDGTEGPTICCAYVPVPGLNLAPAILKRETSRFLPHYMIPARWMVLDCMPHNSNGKTDRGQIRERFRKQSGESQMAAQGSSVQSGSKETHAHAR